MPPCGGHHEAIGNIGPEMGFKSCPRVGGIMHAGLFSAARGVSSRAPVWGASEIGNRKNGKLPFQVVPPCGGHRAESGRFPHFASCFKSCPRVGGINSLIFNFITSYSFKSCPRVGGIAPGGPVCGRWRTVSSRAPVWGASNFVSRIEAANEVSSRAPVWGASLTARKSN